MTTAIDSFGSVTIFPFFFFYKRNVCLYDWQIKEIRVTQTYKARNWILNILWLNILLNNLFSFIFTNPLQIQYWF